MLGLEPPQIDRAAETRRRELPASVAVTVLVGGLSAAILGAPGPIGWALAMTAALIADADLYRRLEAREARAEGRAHWALAGWAFTLSILFTTLPTALWLSGAAAASAAAMVLWVAGVVRQLGAAGGSALIAAAGAAPPALAMLFSPMLMAMLTDEPDWDLAVICAVGGGALLAYVVQSRLAAEAAARALRARMRNEDSEAALAWLAIEQSPLEACLVNRELNVAAMTKAMRRAWDLDGEALIGRGFDDVFAWRPPQWRAAILRALEGETVLRAEDVVATPGGVRWLVWEARPWRDSAGDVQGALLSWRDVTALAEARRAAETESANARRTALAADADAEALAQVRAALERVGFSVRTAESAQAARAALAEAPAGVVVVDGALSDGAGWALMRDLAADGVAVLSHGAAEMRGEALRLGACEHLVKPAEREVLAAAALRFARAPANQDDAAPANVQTA